METGYSTKNTFLAACPATKEITVITILLLVMKHFLIKWSISEKSVLFFTTLINKLLTFPQKIIYKLKLIKNTLNSIKEEYALKMNIFNKVPIVKALKQFRKYIKENKESIMINNHILNIKSKIFWYEFF